MMVSIITAILRFYQCCISPLFPPVCRFSPSCSSYAIQAVHRYGAGMGLFTAFKRLIRCHPFCAGGHDPIK